MIHYDFAGLVVASTFALPGLVTLVRVGDFAEIQVEMDDGPPPRGKPVHSWRGFYELSLESLGDDWLVRHAETTGIVILDRGRTLRCYCPDSARVGVMAEIVVRRILPRVSTFFDRFPMHAASLSDGRGVTLLLGASGAGKSTMTAALADRIGWTIFADDMSVLAGGGELMAYPTSPGVSVRQMSQTGLALPADQCRPLQGRKDKMWFTPTGARDVSPRPVKAVILLSHAAGDDIETRPMFGPPAVVALARQLVVFNPRDHTHIESRMARLTRTIDRLPVYALSYPHDFRLLPLVIDSIRAIRDAAKSDATAGAP